MTDFAADLSEPASTTLDTDLGTQGGGGGAPRTLEEPQAEPEAKPSLRDALSAAMKEGEAKTDDKPADDAKAEPAKEEAEPKDEEGEAAEPKQVNRSEDGKFAAREAKDGDKHVGPEAPKNFLPDAKELWRNTPRSVKRDVDNMAREYERQVEQHREVSERYEAVREFDEVARQHGGDLRQTLARVAEVESLMASNPIAAINSILMQAGPRKADGQPYSLFEVAQSVVNGGQDRYNEAVQVRQQAQQAQPNAEVEQLRQQMAEMQAQTMEATVIAPFRTEHPRYDELREDIAFFLRSGRIPQSLNPADRLEAAYDMAVRINPSPSVDDPAPAAQVPDRRVDTSNGSKSIKSTPGAVSSDAEPKRGGSIGDMLRSNLKRSAMS